MKKKLALANQVIIYAEFSLLRNQVDKRNREDRRGNMLMPHAKAVRGETKAPPPCKSAK